MNNEQASVMSIRTVLWDFRELIVHHLVQHDCAVSQWAADAIAKAGWTRDSYELAILFDEPELLVEVTK